MHDGMDYLFITYLVGLVCLVSAAMDKHDWTFRGFVSFALSPVVIPTIHVIVLAHYARYWNEPEERQRVCENLLDRIGW